MTPLTDQRAHNEEKRGEEGRKEETQLKNQKYLSNESIIIQHEEKTKERRREKKKEENNPKNTEKYRKTRIPTDSEPFQDEINKGKSNHLENMNTNMNYCFSSLSIPISKASIAFSNPSATFSSMSINSRRAMVAVFTVS